MTLSIPEKLFVRKEDDTFKILKAIEDGGFQIALVIDSNRKLIGTITDGDVRRSILKSKTIKTNAENIMNRQFKFVNSGENSKEIEKMLLRYKLKQIPVINGNGEVIDIYSKNDEIMEYLPNSIVIMAGGKGTRLMPYTKNIPKPMVKINGKPILEIVINNIKQSGLKNIYLSVNHFKEQIIDYFEDGSKLGLNIKYLIEESPLGTAGSLKLLPRAINKPILVINGDVLTSLNPSHLLSFHNDQNSIATLCVREEKINVPFGVVETKGTELVSFQEKPTFYKLVNAGIYVIDPILLDLIPYNEYLDMPQLLELAQNQKHKISVCPMHEYWIDIGRPEMLEKANKEWAG